MMFMKKIEDKNNCILALFLVGYSLHAEKLERKRKNKMEVKWIRGWR